MKPDRDSSSAMEQAIRRERERLARELHDSVVPEVYTLGLFLDALALALRAGKSEVVERNLVELRTVTRESLASLRLVLLGLIRRSFTPST